VSEERWTRGERQEGEGETKTEGGDVIKRASNIAAKVPSRQVQAEVDPPIQLNSIGFLGNRLKD